MKLEHRRDEEEKGEILVTWLWICILCLGMETSLGPVTGGSFLRLRSSVRLLGSFKRIPGACPICPVPSREVGDRDREL